MLETVTSITRQFPATLFVGVVGLLSQTAYFGIWIFASVFAAGNFLLPKENGVKDGEETPEISGLGQVVLIYYFFNYFWTSQIIRNTVHVTVCTWSKN